MPSPPATYDPTTDAGKVRFLIADTDEVNYVFTDAEIGVFLLLAPANLQSAAALACETWARSQAKLTAEVREADGSSRRRRTVSELLELAAALRSSALTDAGLVIDTIDTSTPNEYLDSYRPEWRGITDLPVVE
jgi:hypothetical protein